MAISRTFRRAAAVGAMAVPLAFVAGGIASAGESHDYDHDNGNSRQGDDCGDATAVQKGGLIDLGIDISPLINAGGILNSGPVYQSNYTVDQSNSGIQQADCAAGDAFQLGDVVGAALDVSPNANVGGILNSGQVYQSNYTVDQSNSGVQQAGGSGHGGSGHGSGYGGHGGSGHGGSGTSGPTAVQGGGGGLLGSLLSLDLKVSPGLNLGGILSGGSVAQGNTQWDASNSGIQQS
jgi:hypothetical protein